SDRVMGTLCSDGHLVTRQLWARCMAGHGVRRLEVYQPVSRFWTFQLAELGAYVALAAALLAVTCWLGLRPTSWGRLRHGQPPSALRRVCSHEAPLGFPRPGAGRAAATTG